MIYHVNFHNLLPNKKKLFKTHEEIYSYVTELINQQISELEKKLKSIDRENMANLHEIHDIENDIRMLKLKEIHDNELLKSLSITKIDEEKCPDYKEIFKEML